MVEPLYVPVLAFLSERGMGIRVLRDTAPDEPESSRLPALRNRLLTSGACPRVYDSDGAEPFHSAHD
ncbi:hypothetical protein ABB07_28465 [Streptomyces incarnatus]|uniref:Uncharacterized protein n=1 Tax=Streptomyces incarnatus TaxID=665007 RepID=A0ABM5TS11_9ACTN|nr:hypothetical protein [Streptomyces incarnatus]AKJ13831.1 hypothetical protein ABB07_28465 [Streptomyces incarnatus]